jgi:uncharacterized repeat protein (TIGR03803 family)
MRQERPLTRQVIIFAITIGALSFATLSYAADKEKVLLSFNGSSGAQPRGGLVFDKAGNLYGTTAIDGPSFYGGVFQLTPGPNGTWNENVLASEVESFAGLTFDRAGNLYGTSYTSLYPWGSIFELTPGPNNTWTETTPYGFGGGTDAGTPLSSVIFDSAGNMYGTTYYGGIMGGCNGDGCGTVYQLTPGPNDTWTESVLHRFSNTGGDGSSPEAALVLDGSGNLYGTSLGGGLVNGGCIGSNDTCGTVFELMPGPGGTWTTSTIYQFCSVGNCTDGKAPSGSLVVDAAGNLYGTTGQGGAHGCGSVFELTPGGGGAWSEKVLYSFGAVASDKDGCGPLANLIFDASGNLYGTAQFGGAHSWGVAFELVNKKGKWTEKVLTSFTGKNGAYPYCGLVFDGAGGLYGTTSVGGSTFNKRTGSGDGAVFELIP